MAVCALGALSASSAQAATGDTLRSITAGGGGCSVNVGLAIIPGSGGELDGAMSCYDDSRIDIFKLSDGSLKTTLRPVGVSQLGAMAYDATRGVIWACSGFNQIVTIDPATAAVTPQFVSSGCFDGLAYDGSDDTLFSSNDAQCPVYHYKTDGTSLGSGNCSGLLGGPGNSGIAVGGPDLYLANNGGQQIYQVPKTFASSTLFHQGDRRLEDLECDGQTFSTGAIWFIDAYDREVQALEIPSGLCGSGGLPPTEGPSGDPSCSDGFDNDGDGQIDNADGDCGGVVEEAGFMSGRAWAYNGPNSYNNVGLKVLVSGAGDASRSRRQMHVPCDGNDLLLDFETKWGFHNKLEAQYNKFTATGFRSPPTCTDNPGYDEGSPNAGFDSLVAELDGTYQGVPGARAEITLIDKGENSSGNGIRIDRVRVKVWDPDGNLVLEKPTRFIGAGNIQANPAGA